MTASPFFHALIPHVFFRSNNTAMLVEAVIF